MDIQVTSVSKGAEDFSKAPSAIFVLTQEDLRRSGMNTMPEALRMVPGMQIPQIDSSTWAITARGFNSRFEINIEASRHENLQISSKLLRLARIVNSQCN